MIDKENRVRIYRDDAMDERDRTPQEIKEEMEENIERGLRTKSLERKIIEIKNKIRTGEYDQRLYNMVFERTWFGESLKNKEYYYDEPDRLDDFIEEQLVILGKQDNEQYIKLDNINTLYQKTDRAWQEENKNFIKMFEEATNDNQKIILDNIDLKDIIGKNIRGFKNDPESFVLEQRAINDDLSEKSNNISLLNDKTTQEWRSNNKYFETDFLNGTIDYQNFILENIDLKDEISAYITENKNKYWTKPWMSTYNKGLSKIVHDYRNKEAEVERKEWMEREREREMEREREREVKEQRKQQAKKTTKQNNNKNTTQRKQRISKATITSPQQGIKPQQLLQQPKYPLPDIASEVFFAKHPADVWTSGDSGSRVKFFLKLMGEETFHESNINEKAYDPRFLKRVVGLERQERKTGEYGPIWDKSNRLPNNGLFCPDKYTYYEYAELKSSLLVKLIVEKHNKDLGNFMYENIKNCFYLVCGRTSNIDLFLIEYSKLFNNKDPFRYANTPHHDYPVLDPTDLKSDPTIIKDDLYAAYNLNKFMWKILDHGHLQLDSNELGNFQQFHPDLKNLELVTTFIQMIQQSYFTYGDRHKLDQRVGIERHNKPRPKWRKKPSGLYTELEFSNGNNQVGITNLEHKTLATTNTPWNHPGRSGCRISYKGSYGSKRYDAANSIGNKQNLHASVQCGISGSMNYPLTIFLISCLNNVHFTKDSNKPPFANNSTDVKKLILSGISGLVSDGGHNVVEVITGFTICSIGLKKLKDTLINECNWIRARPQVGNDYIYEYVYNLKEDVLNSQHIILAPLYVKFLIPGSITMKDTKTGKKSMAIGSYNNEKEIFNFVLESLIHLSPVIDELYYQMKHINPMGMYRNTEIYPSYTLNKAINDLNNNKNYEQFNYFIEVNALRSMIWRNRDTIGINSCIMVTALDNYMERNKYDFDSGPTDFVIKLLGDLKYTDVITDVDKLMEARLKQCDPDELLPFDNKDIPYAGGKKKQSRQRKKKQSIRHKKKQSIKFKKKQSIRRKKKQSIKHKKKQSIKHKKKQSIKHKKKQSITHKKKQSITHKKK